LHLFGELLLEEFVCVGVHVELTHQSVFNVAILFDLTQDGLSLHILERGGDEKTFANFAVDRAAFDEFINRCL